MAHKYFYLSPSRWHNKEGENTFGDEWRQGKNKKFSTENFTRNTWLNERQALSERERKQRSNVGRHYLSLIFIIIWQTKWNSRPSHPAWEGNGEGKKAIGKLGKTTTTKISRDANEADSSVLFTITNNFFITTHLNHCHGHIKDIDISLYQYGIGLQSVDISNIGIITKHTEFLFGFLSSFRSLPSNAPRSIKFD